MSAPLGHSSPQRAGVQPHAPSASPSLLLGGSLDRSPQEPIVISLPDRPAAAILPRACSNPRVRPAESSDGVQWAAACHGAVAAAAPQF